MAFPSISSSLDPLFFLLLSQGTSLVHKIQAPTSPIWNPHNEFPPNHLFHLHSCHHGLHRAHLNSLIAQIYQNQNFQINFDHSFLLDPAEADWLQVGKIIIGLFPSILHAAFPHVDWRTLLQTSHIFRPAAAHFLLPSHTLIFASHDSDFYIFLLLCIFLFYFFSFSWAFISCTFDISLAYIDPHTWVTCFALVFFGAICLRGSRPGISSEV